MRAILALFILLVVAGLLAGCVGFYYLCNSRAVEYAISRLADSGAGLIDKVGVGVFWLLIVGAVAVILRFGAVPAGKAAILMLAAPKVAGAIERGQPTQLPGPFTIERIGIGPERQLEEPRPPSNPWGHDGQA